MPEVPTGQSVVERSLERIRSIYSEGHRVLVAFSGGKDSTIVLNLCIQVAREYDALPVEVSFFDEEIIYPGVVEYIERVRDREEIDLNWIWSEAPRTNAFSREHPFWWTFDSRLSPSEWARQPPAGATRVEDADMRAATKVERFPPPPGKSLVVMLGIRASESRNRRMSVFSSMGFLCKVNKFGHRPARPIFDWKDSDVWKAISEFKWDYASTYNTMYRLGVSRSRLRVGPPTMTAAAVGKLQMASKAWPRWFDRLCYRLPGTRTAAKFGKKAITAQRRLGETWKECYYRTCVTEGPPWLAERAAKYAELRMRQHKYHSNEGLPEVVSCATCYCNGSWKALTKSMFMGDPLSIKDGSLPYMQPGQFREGAENWFKKNKKGK